MEEILKYQWSKSRLRQHAAAVLFLGARRYATRKLLCVCVHPAEFQVSQSVHLSVDTLPQSAVVVEVISH